MAGLKDHFGVWRRCGNLPVWARDQHGSGSVRTFVDPIEGILVSWHEFPHIGAGKAIVRTSRIKVNAHPEVLEEAFNRIPDHRRETLRWFMRTVMVSAAFGWTKDQTLRWFLEAYREQGEAYREGTEKADEFMEPAREEILNAIQHLFGNLGDRGVEREEHVVPLDRLDEALADFGVMECP